MEIVNFEPHDWGLKDLQAGYINLGRRERSKASKKFQPSFSLSPANPLAQVGWGLGREHY